MKRLFFVLIFAASLSLPCPSFAVPADVEKLSGPDYFPAVDKALGETKKPFHIIEGTLLRCFPYCPKLKMRAGFIF